MKICLGRRGGGAGRCAGSRAAERGMRGAWHCAPGGTPWIGTLSLQNFCQVNIKIVLDFGRIRRKVPIRTRLTNTVDPRHPTAVAHP